MLAILLTLAVSSPDLVGLAKVCLILMVIGIGLGLLWKFGPSHLHIPVWVIWVITAVVAIVLGFWLLRIIQAA